MLRKCSPWKKAISIAFMNIVVGAVGNEAFCKKENDIFSLPEDYNALLEPKSGIIVRNDIQLLNVIQVRHVITIRLRCEINQKIYSG